MQINHPCFYLTTSPCFCNHRLLPQVYMVAMDREELQKGKQNVNDEEEVDGRMGSFSSGESLLSLVQPEMKTLSKQWLAALKDHALLALPSGTRTLSKQWLAALKDHALLALPSGTRTLSKQWLAALKDHALLALPSGTRTLSKQWLAALKDHALLALPSGTRTLSKPWLAALKDHALLALPSGTRTLSKQWLAALKDHALLALPSGARMTSLTRSLWLWFRLTNNLCCSRSKQQYIDNPSCE